MIKAEDLRIGNYYIGGDGNIYRADPNTIYDTYHNKGMKLKPIPLTEEWLIKFGFSKWVDNVYFIEYECRPEVKQKIRVFYEINRVMIDFNCVLSSNIKHVHQLQNLYHSLTGCELKIK